MIYKEEDLQSIDSLKMVTAKLNSIKNKRKCIDADIYYISNDDRDAWLLEYKINGKYHVIQRIEPEEEVIKFINLLMHLGNERGYRIYKSTHRYDEY